MASKQRYLIFFQGWSFQENFFKHEIASTTIMTIAYPYDLTVEIVEDTLYFKYTDINLGKEIVQIVPGDSEIIFMGWSFGVFYLNQFLDKYPLLTRYPNYGINGNPQMLGGKYGIMSKMFTNTLEGLNRETKILFDRNCGYYEATNYSDEAIVQFRQELIAFQEEFTKLDPRNHIQHLLIGSGDRILPAKRQLKYAEEYQLKHVIVDAPHYIFDKYTLIEAIIGEEYAI